MKITLPVFFWFIENKSVFPGWNGVGLVSDVLKATFSSLQRMPLILILASEWIN